MSQPTAFEPNSSELSEAELKLLAQLHANPIMAEQLCLLMNRFEQEVGTGMDAHQSDEIAIEQLRLLGQSLLRRSLAYQKR